MVDEPGTWNSSPASCRDKGTSCPECARGSTLIVHAYRSGGRLLQSVLSWGHVCILAIRCGSGSPPLVWSLLKKLGTWSRPDKNSTFPGTGPILVWVSMGRAFGLTQWAHRVLSASERMMSSRHIFVNTTRILILWPHSRGQRVVMDCGRPGIRDVDRFVQGG